MTVKICEWCVRAKCGCKWHGYRARATRDEPRPCPWCKSTRRPVPRTSDVIHQPGTACRFAPPGTPM